MCDRCATECLKKKNECPFCKAHVDGFTNSSDERVPVKREPKGPAKEVEGPDQDAINAALFGNEFVAGNGIVAGDRPLDNYGFPVYVREQFGDDVQPLPIAQLQADEKWQDYNPDDFEPVVPPQPAVQPPADEKWQDYNPDDFEPIAQAAPIVDSNGNIDERLAIELAIALSLSANNDVYVP
jgi:hypothetical protein